MSPDFKIVGLQGLTFGVDDFDAAVRFLQDWNLRPLSVGPDSASYETEEGAGITIRRSNDAALPPAAGGKSTLRELLWAVESNDELAKIRAELEKDCAVSVDDGVVRVVDPTGYALGFTVSTLRQLPTTYGDVNFPGAPVRLNRAVDFTAPPTVRHLGHVAVFAPDFENALAFYTTRLGFRVSDIYPGRGVFLRAAGSHDHHNLFLVLRGDAVGFHHMSFEVSDFHEVMNGGRLMEKKGWESQFGPGRHTLGSNYFW